MADTITIRKRPLGHGESGFVAEVFASTTGSVVLNPEPIFTITVPKNVFDAIDAGWSLPGSGADLAGIISATYGVTEV